MPKISPAKPYSQSEKATRKVRTPTESAKAAAGQLSTASAVRKSPASAMKKGAIELSGNNTGQPLLHADRFFDSDPAIRRAAREIFAETSGLPLICPHGHVDPALLANNQPFPEPTALLINPDHYIYRMLYSRGIPMEELGVPARDGSTGGADPRKVWRLFAQNYYLFRGTPTGV